MTTTPRDEQSTKEADDLAIHTILDEAHDAYDDLEDRSESLQDSRRRLSSDAYMLRYLAGASLAEERSYLLDFTARIVRQIELIDLEAAEQ